MKIKIRYLVDQVKNLIQLTSPEIHRYFGMSFLVGAALSINEVSIAFILQLLVGFLGSNGTYNGSIFGREFHLTLITSGVFFLVLAIIKSFLLWYRGVLQADIVDSFMHFSRKRITSWSFSQPNANTGNITTLLNDRTGSTSGVLVCLQNILIDATFAIVIMIYLMTAFPVLSVLLISVVVVLGIIIKIISAHISQKGSLVSQEGKLLYNLLFKNLKNITLFRIYGMKKKELGKIHNSLDRFLIHTRAYVKFSELLSVLPQFFGAFIFVLLLFLNSKLSLIRNDALILFSYTFFRLIQQFSSISNLIAKLAFKYNQVEDLANWWKGAKIDLDIVEKDFDRSVLANVEITKSFNWILENVTFKFNGSNKNIFENFSTKFKSGNITLVLGESGKGKSTLLNFLLGELVPTSGKVSIDHAGVSIPVQDVKLALYKKIGYVGPDPFIFEGTIYENLCFGLENKPNESDVSKVLHQAEIGFLAPDVYQRKITEQGDGLSAGQRQRLSLARALLREPLALILDEATSNLDLKTEKNILETLSKLKEKMAIVLVSHRDSAISYSDEIINLD